MIASYHTHTYRCNHAVGSDEEYILKAIAEGVKVLGFADHAPMPYTDGFVSTYKMRPDEIDGYFSSLLSLREKYKDKIEIKIGFETEYYPSLWEKSLKFWSNYPLDYLILGQHFAPEEEALGASYSGYRSDDKQRLIDYTDCVIDAMNTGLITYVAHPDLINYTGDDSDLLLHERTRLIKEAVRLDIPLEYNLLGMVTKRNYPDSDFFRLAGELGAGVILGCDSHSPDRVVDSPEIACAKETLASFGITPINEVSLAPVFNR